jgi:hypothetical protein
MTTAQRGQLTLDAIAAVDLVGEGASALDVLDLADNPEDVVSGLVQYVNYLEVVVHLARGGCGIEAVRQAGRNASQALIEKGGSDA